MVFPVMNEIIFQDHTVAEASRQYNIPHSTVFGWNKKAAAVGLSISQGRVDDGSNSLPKNEKKFIVYIGNWSVIQNP